VEYPQNCGLLEETTTTDGDYEMSDGPSDRHARTRQWAGGDWFNWWTFNIADNMCRSSLTDSTLSWSQSNTLKQTTQHHTDCGTQTYIPYIYQIAVLCILHIMTKSH